MTKTIEALYVKVQTNIFKTYQPRKFEYFFNRINTYMRRVISEEQKQELQGQTPGFWASLYNTKINIALNEMRLIWTRYSGFLVLQGLIVNVLAGDFGGTTKTLALSFIGLASSAIWHILNHAGWLNQNAYLMSAANINFKEIRLPLVTDWWVSKNALKPTGMIYQLSQLIPLSFMLLYSIAIAMQASGFVLRFLHLSSDHRYLITLPISLLLFGFVFLFCLVIEKREYKNRKRIKDDRIFS